MRTLNVFIGELKVGQLTMSGLHEYSFTYSTRNPALSIALSMPVRQAPYVTKDLHPIFQQNLPEGLVLETLRTKYGKMRRLDPFGLLELTGGNCISRVRCLPPKDFPEPDDFDANGRINDLLHEQNASALFDEMLHEFASRSGISGLQPKFLLNDEAGGRHAVIKTDHVIVKSAMDDPTLAINEYLCMFATRAAGLPTANNQISDNGEVLIVGRFDIGIGGVPVAFEDFCAILAKTSPQRYEGSYDDIVEAIGWHCPSARLAIEDFYKANILNHLVGNGDAHLKNFGVLYEGPGEVRMAPYYDITNTTLHNPSDVPALRYSGRRGWLTKSQMEDWGKQVCGISPRALKRLNQEAIEGVRCTTEILDKITVPSHADFAMELKNLWRNNSERWESGEQLVQSDQRANRERMTG